MSIDLGLYDSATSKSLKPLKVVDVTEHQDRDTVALLVFTRAERGRIIQLQQGSLRIHYFLDERGGKAMMGEDSERFGFKPGQLLALAEQHAPR